MRSGRFIGRLASWLPYYIILIFSLSIFTVLFYTPGDELRSEGVRTNEGIAICLIDRGLRLPAGWYYDQKVDCSHYER